MGRAKSWDHPAGGWHIEGPHAPKQVRAEGVGSDVDAEAVTLAGRGRLGPAPSRWAFVAISHGVSQQQVPNRYRFSRTTTLVEPLNPCAGTTVARY